MPQTYQQALKFSTWDSRCRQYKYLVLLNSSVRGPFLPSYMPPGFHWTAPFLSKITEEVKLVGSTINCGGAYGHPPVPHVQTYVVATDSRGLEVLAEAVRPLCQHVLRLSQYAKGTVFHCWENMAETVIHSELGASQAIIKAGYNLDSLMLRYQVHMARPYEVRSELVP
ncbi:hypothetical protein MMC07_002630 [Pseudocyphellaria aurata]|nr:hypothetical protein [Pseudocyphellaria aurata]